MTIFERRQHVRIDDHLHFEYRIIHPNEAYTDQDIENILLGKQGLNCIESHQRLKEIDQELAQLREKLALSDPTMAHYLNLLNAKIDFISQNLSVNNPSKLRKVNISLGGMAFKTPEKIDEKTPVKLIIYTKPNMIPLIVDSTVVYCQYQSEKHFHTAVEFISLTKEQEQLLSMHIMQAQVSMRAD